MRRLFFPLALLLAACSYTLTVDLGSMTLNLSGLRSTSPFPGDAYVVFPKDPQTFNPPPVDVVRGIRVEGQAVANVALSQTLTVYGRLQDPAQDPACQASVNLVLCPVGEAGEALGTIAFQGQAETPFTLSGDVLVQGVRRGKLWFGLRVEGVLPSGLTRLELKELKAHVTVGL
ncbi:hypothetical protein [Thermus scotoductus]|uniref:hypothetical protein n=1 Tax=Thermus scotoductus TaxID=37636 RepID=UPI002430883F|nr:hypothetical protein [Thermus scotoductus]